MVNLNSGGQRKLGLSLRLLLVTLSVAPAFAPATRAGQATEPKEVSATDVQPNYTLQSQRNLVTVRAVVRDASGKVVETLHKEGFEIRDRGKRQEIENFSLEKPGQPSGTVKPSEPGESATIAPGEVSAPAMASRFVALLFDDKNTLFEDLKRSRDAASLYLSSAIKPGDRIALFTSSRKNQVDFTPDVASIQRALLALRGQATPYQDSCDSMPPYEAYVSADSIADGAGAITADIPRSQGSALDKFVKCICAGAASTDSHCLLLAQNRAREVAEQTRSINEIQVLAVLREVESVVRRMTTLPGQRSVVIVSDGFLALSGDDKFQLDHITERALQGGVTVNALDARGLYGDVLGDASLGGPHFELSDLSYLREGARRQSEAMRNLAHDTGGVFFENSNDYDAGFRKVAGNPEAYYLLTFSPQNLKHDGLYHTISVTLPGVKGLKVQARAGYFAPPKSEDAAAEAKDEIREALYSTEESQTVPIDVHTQFFKESAQKASVAVLTHVDLHPLRFSKQGDRNVDQLTFVTALFDIDGKAVSIQQKVLDFRMHDATLAKFLQTGVTLRGNFDVAPGTYKVREVVRESQSGQISTLNRTVEIPYE